MAHRSQISVISIFSGCGSLYLGFQRAKLQPTWTLEDDPTVIETLLHNIPSVQIIEKLPVSDMGQSPTGAICAPHTRQQLHTFLEYISVVQPLFFVVVLKKHLPVPHLLHTYNICDTVVDAHEYGAGANGKYRLIVGYSSIISTIFSLPKSLDPIRRATLETVIGDLRSISPIAVRSKNTASKALTIANHEYFDERFTQTYQSRNRYRDWQQSSLSLPPNARYVPLHPDGNRRLSVCEAARIQTFPDDFEFIYTDVADGYKMIGNTVPVLFAETIAKQIKQDLDRSFASIN